MRLFDMHCDTLYRAYTEESTLFDDSFHISFNKIGKISPYIQCLAVWIPDEYRGEAAWRLFEGCVGKLKEQLENTDITWCKTAEDIRKVNESKGKGIILTVEGGAVLGGDIRKIQTLYDIGVRMMTLTWNGRNEIGDGIGEADDKGLTDFGKAAVKEMEKVGIIIDVSHAGEKLFWDVAEITTKPFVASHSNIRTVTPHKRNLTEEQFKELIRRGGITGLNFCAEFLNKSKTNAQMYDIIEHAGYFLSLGGKNNIAMGGDFDGAEIPPDLTGIESMPKLYDMFISHFGREISDAIFFGNAYSFFTENLE
ncbi:MAG: membrane dipeptidase [Clostridia bacterium]|nr:membrane dipeptidase [Clostridia bacterium]